MGFRWRFPQHRQRDESHLNRQQESQSCLPSEAARPSPGPQKPYDIRILARPSQRATPHVPGDLPPTPGAGGPHGSGSSNNGPSSSRFLFVAWRRRRHHPGRHDIHSGYGASRGTGEEKGVELSKPTCLAQLHKAGAVIRLWSILARSPER